MVLEAAEGVDRGAELEEDLVAGALLLDHPGNAPDLPLDPPEAGVVVVAVGPGPLHHADLIQYPGMVCQGPRASPGGLFPPAASWYPPAVMTTRDDAGAGPDGTLLPGRAGEPEAEHRPWGFYEVLGDRPDHKVKRITVLPGKRLSLQRHRRRSEHWHVVSGEAFVTVDGQEVPLRPGDSVNICCGAMHRIRNAAAAPVVFIEVQRGDYFGEDDIERFEDDYGRV